MVNHIGRRYRHRYTTRLGSLPYAGEEESAINTATSINSVHALAGGRCLVAVSRLLPAVCPSNARQSTPRAARNDNDEPGFRAWCVLVAATIFSPPKFSRSFLVYG